MQQVVLYVGGISMTRWCFRSLKGRVEIFGREGFEQRFAALGIQKLSIKPSCVFDLGHVAIIITRNEIDCLWNMWVSAHMARVIQFCITCCS